MKSVLHAALIGPGYSNKGLMDGFMATGFDTYHCFDFQLESFRIGRDLMRRSLVHEAQKIKPDLIFCQIQTSEILDSETWGALSKIAFVVNYTFDVRINAQTQWMYELVPHIGLTCFSNLEDVEECNRRGYDNVMLLQSSADPDVYKPSVVKDRNGVVFIGNNFQNTNHEFPLSKERAEMVEFLRKEFPDQFKVYGNNWGNSHITSHKDGINEEVEILQSAAIAVNHNNLNPTSYCSDRVWRTLFSGALCLTKYFKGIEKLFTRYEDLDWWENFDELKDQINYYLQHREKAYQIGIRGMQQALLKHTWSSRVKEMMEFIGRLNVAIIDNRDGCTKAGAHVIGGVIPQMTDEHFKGMPCDCGKLRGDFAECGCGDKQYQFRWVENI